MNYYLAIDIGASSGRHIAAWREQGEIKMKEVYRFDNFPETENGHLVWNLSRLCDEVINGLVACKETGITPTSVGIDTWAVDYVLLDAKNQPLHPMFCYRDRRGEEGAELVHKIIPFTDLYKKTGIQYQPFNTIYQMYWDKVHGRLDGAEDFLMLPEYLSFLLSGVKRHEYTNATSTGLLDARTRKWDIETIRELELPERLFRQEPVMPPIKLGQLTEEIAEKVGFSCDVILPATHDTASAVVAVPRVEVGGTSLAYISSGTWSLLGTELETPVTTIFAESANFTNEGGVGTIRF